MRNKMLVVEKYREGKLSAVYPSSGSVHQILGYIIIKHIVHCLPESVLRIIAQFLYGIEAGIEGRITAGPNGIAA